MNEIYYKKLEKKYEGVPSHWSNEYFNMIERQIGIFNFQDQEKIKNAHIAVLGCGGYGMVAEQLVRAGCENLTICDFDQVAMTNLNRQIGTRNDIGKNKIDVISKKIKAINPDVNIRKFYGLTEDNVSEILEGIEISINQMDDLISAIMAFRECRKRNINAIWSLGCPLLFTMWFTKNTATYEEVLGLSSDISIEEIQKNQDKIYFKQVLEKLFKKFLSVPNVSKAYRDIEIAIRRYREKKDRMNISWNRLSVAYTTFDIINAGILNIKNKSLAPIGQFSDYYNWKIYQIDFTK